MTFYVSKDSAPWRKADSYKLIAASQTTSQLGGGTNAVGDYLDRIIVIPATTAQAACNVCDGPTAVIAIPAMITGALSLAPYTIDCGMIATSTKGWNITTGANVSIVAVGAFDNDGV